MKLLDQDKFGKCHLVVDPVIYLSACQQDLCKPGSNQMGACESLAAYARECKRKGICLDWRDGFCPYDCPIGKRYEACSCDKTCEQLDLLKPNQKLKCEEISEGCFCPAGTYLRGKECVAERLCKECDDGEHYPGDEWVKDKCTNCICDKTGKTQCVKKECATQESICSE
uniref:VWF/SSPO/Zonadhesin-like cysteine-rich domain-containing protein n=1 Tax=Megaselia scalaris TaxID=36166 RepID=T1GGD2_MEGSC